MDLRDLQRLHEQFNHGPVTIEMTSAHPALTAPTVKTGRFSKRARKSAVYACSTVILAIASAAAGVGAARFSTLTHQVPASAAPAPRAPAAAAEHPASLAVVDASGHPAGVHTELGSASATSPSLASPQMLDSARPAPQLTFDQAALNSVARAPMATREPGAGPTALQPSAVPFSSPVRVPLLERAAAKASDGGQGNVSVAAAPATTVPEPSARVEAPSPAAPSAPRKIATQGVPKTMKHVVNGASASPASGVRDQASHSSEPQADRPHAASAATEVKMF